MRVIGRFAPARAESVARSTHGRAARRSPARRNATTFAARLIAGHMPDPNA
jgi:hypothetical protein